VRIIDIRERPIRISRYRDPRIPSGGLTTSLVAVVTDVVRAGRPVATASLRSDAMPRVD
jgi:hypothetical protein